MSSPAHDNYDHHVENVPDPWRPNRLAALAPTAVAALGVVYATSVPGWYFTWVALLALAWVFIGLIWLGTLARILSRTAPLARLRREWPVWSPPPVLALLVGGLVYMGAPMEARFAGFIGGTGFAWSPDGEPPQVGGAETYVHLRGPWYTWREGI